MQKCKVEYHSANFLELHFSLCTSNVIENSFCVNFHTFCANFHTFWDFILMQQCARHKSSDNNGATFFSACDLISQALQTDGNV